MQTTEQLIGEIKDVIWWIDGYLTANCEYETRLKDYHVKALSRAIEIIVERES